MILIAYSEKIPCIKAVRDTEKREIIVYETENSTQKFCGISHFEDFTLEGGEWSRPTPTEAEQLRADVDYLEMENESLTAEAEQSRADIDYAMMLLGEEVE